MVYSYKNQEKRENQPIMRLLSCALVTELTVAGVAITVWLALLRRADCGWRWGQTCEQCGARFAFECAGSCVLSYTDLNAGPSNIARAANGSCCNAVFLNASAAPWPSPNAPMVFGGYHVAATLSSGGRPVYKRFDTFLFYWPHSGADFSAGWRVSSNYRTQTSAIRQAGSGNATCPSQVTDWEFYDGAAFVPDMSINVSCAPELPADTRCSSPTRSDAFGSRVAAAWSLLVAIGVALHAATHHRRGRAGPLIRTADAALAVGWCLVALASGTIGWLVGHEVSPSAPPSQSMGVALIGFTIEAALLFMACHTHDGLRHIRRTQPKAAGLYCSAVDPTLP